MVKHVWTLAACLSVLATPAVQADDTAKLRTDLAAVPGSAIGFVHVHVAELWKGDLLKEMRTIIEKAGPSAMKAFDERFIPKPSSLDRITAIVLAPQGGSPEPPLVVVIATSEAFDRDKLIKGVFPEAKEANEGKLIFHVDDKSGLAVYVIDNKTFAFAPQLPMRNFLSQKPDGNNPFASALQEASRKQVFAAFSTSLLPGEAIAELPPPLQPLARAKMIQASLDMGKDVRVDLKLTFADEAQAKTGEEAAKDGVKMARQALSQFRKEMEEKLMPKKPGEISPITELPEAALALAALGYLQHGDEFLRDLPLVRQGQTLSSWATIPAGPYTQLLAMSGLSAGFMLPAVQKVREAASRAQSTNNHKQIGLAMHNYADTFNGFPAAAICDKNGKPLLSWRVSILPYIEEAQLYKEFHLDEPWDSEHNKKLIPKMPKVYLLPGIGQPGETTTYYRVFHSNGGLFEQRKQVRFADITDGTSNTIMVVEANEAVTWTKPDDFEYDPKKPLPKLGKQNPQGFVAAFADGSVRFITHKVSEQTLRALITKNGGEVIGSDF